MLTVVVAMLLQAVISQMNVVILIIERILVAASTEISLFVIIEFLFVIPKCPHSYIELSPFK